MFLAGLREGMHVLSSARIGHSVALREICRMNPSGSKGSKNGAVGPRYYDANCIEYLKPHIWVRKPLNPKP